jgi:hypothetical protein
MGFWETLKSDVIVYGQPFLMKMLTRWLTTGLAFACAALGMASPNQSEQTKVVEFIAAGALALAGVLIDRIHHLVDRNFTVADEAAPQQVHET